MYTNDDNLTREQLREIPITSRSDVSKQWEGVQHGVLADTVVMSLAHFGLVPSSELWVCNPSQDTLFGSLDIDPKCHGITSRGLDFPGGQFSLGVRHSNAGRYAVSFALGARVFVCSNGMFVGDFVLKRQHRTSTNLVETVDAGIAQYLRLAPKISLARQQLVDTKITKETAALICLDAAKLGAVAFRYVEDVWDQFEKPRHEEFREYNLWSLYNAFTTVGKSLSVAKQAKMFDVLKDLLRL